MFGLNYMQLRGDYRRGPVITHGNSVITCHHQAEFIFSLCPLASFSAIYQFDDAITGPFYQLHALVMPFPVCYDSPLTCWRVDVNIGRIEIHTLRNPKRKP